MESLEWHYDSAHDLDLPYIERLRHFPREPDMLAYGLRSAAALVVRTYLRTYHRLEISGAKNLPAEGSFVLVANHTSHLDALCLLAALPLAKLHRAFPAAAEDYFFSSMPRVLLATLTMNALPFGRKVHVRQSLALCRRLLANPGNILIIFPEGSRGSRNEIADVRPFKGGIGMLVAGTNVPVVPCWLDGAGRAFPRGRCIPAPRKIRLRIGNPVQFAMVKPEKDSATKIAEELRNAVVALSEI